jgi:hypothetical protein
VLISKEKNVDLSERVKAWHFYLASIEFKYLQYKSRHNVTTTSWSTDRNMRSTTQVTDTSEKEIPIVVDVNEIHTLEYDSNL